MHDPHYRTRRSGGYRARLGFALRLRRGLSSRPIILIVGLAPGGITDVTARVYADAVSRLTNQPVVVENRPGAGGAIAASMSRMHGRTATRFSCSPVRNTQPSPRQARPPMIR